MDASKNEHYYSSSDLGMLVAISNYDPKSSNRDQTLVLLMLCPVTFNLFRSDYIWFSI